MAQIQTPAIGTTTLLNISSVTNSNLTDDLKEYFTQQYQLINNISVLLNQKTHGVLSIESYGNGCQVFPAVVGDPPRGVGFTGVDFGALPNAVLKSVPHNIPFNADTRIIRVSAKANDPIAQLAIPLPYVDVATAGAFNIEMYIDNTNVNILPAGNATAFTDTFIFIEYTT